MTTAHGLRDAPAETTERRQTFPRRVRGMHGGKGPVTFYGLRTPVHLQNMRQQGGKVPNMQEEEDEAL